MVLSYQFSLLTLNLHRLTKMPAVTDELTTDVIVATDLPLALNEEQNSAANLAAAEEVEVIGQVMDIRGQCVRLLFLYSLGLCVNHK